MKGQRGIPRLYRKTYRDRHGETKQTATYYADLWNGGARRTVALDTANKTEATAKLRILMGSLPVHGGTLRLSALLDFVRQDYRQQGYRTGARLELSIRHLSRILGDPNAEAIDSGKIRDYQARRLDEGAARGTVELETCALGRGFALAVDRGRITHAPKIPHLRLRNARQTILTRADVEAIAAHLPYHWRNFVWTAYYTGWRPKREILTRRWSHVDLAGRWIRLERGETKNGDGRLTPITDELREILVNQRAYCTDRERDLGRVIPWVYFNPRNGHRLAVYDHAWHAALKAAGYPARLLYDLRRTRITALHRAGVPLKAAMTWAGHRDVRVHLRYGVVDETALRESAAQVETFEAREREKPTTIRRFS